MELSGKRAALISILAAFALVGCVPATLGYAWAISWLPVHGSACGFRSVFGSGIRPDGYRVFLLNRGCDVDAAIRQIVSSTSGYSVDPARIVAIYHRTARATTADEFLLMDIVRSRLREYAGSRPAPNACLPGGYCMIPESSNEDGLAGKLARAYESYVRRQFLYAAKDGADYLASLLRMGIGMQCIISGFYLAAVFFLGSRMLGLTKMVYRGSASSKDASQSPRTK